MKYMEQKIQSLSITFKHFSFIFNFALIFIVKIKDRVILLDEKSSAFKRSKKENVTFLIECVIKPYNKKSFN